ncbi:hemagglutinin repeat-containing protein [Iodobacter arcticus]|uniref:Hemagglutinin repeat-containing protein n=1 Tax=Iodobacter arcticus TaxID=590593 RepID=A0ABW2QRI5_9NEIS
MNFNLSISGKISAALIMAFVLTENVSANGIVAGGDAAKQAQISTANNGAAVVNIVAPSAAGLSHNQFKDFNVGTAGAVLNNSTIAGQSQLAGQLNANSQLGNQAAKVILNEVVSRNPSLLLGKQEIFGMAADYVLANPNGITCDGCGFINTPRASLLVGNANVQDGQIQSLEAAKNNNLLQVQTGGARGEKVLDLIAPRIDVRGNVQAEKAINAVAGFNSVAFDHSVDSISGKMLTSTAAPTVSGSLDSYYLGAIQAGRVNLISTAAGAGVNITGQVQGQEALNIESAGKLSLSAAQLKGQAISLAAQDIESRGKISTKNTQDQSHNESWFIWKTGETDTKSASSKSSIERSSLQGDDINIKASNAASLAATDIDSNNLNLSAAKVDLDGQLLSNSESSSNNAWKNSWAYNKAESSSTEQQIGTRIKARNDIQISATAGDLNLKGSSIQAANQLELAASGNIALAGLTERDSKSDKGNRKNDGASLQTGSWDNSSSSERLVSTALQSGKSLIINAAGNIDATGAQINAGADSQIAAKGTLNIATQSIANSSQTQNQQKYWGGIGGGGEKNNGTEQSINVRSNINSDGKLSLIGEKGIRVNGSTVKAKQGAYAQATAGGVIIDSARDLSKTSIDQRNGTVFNITSSSNQTKSSVETNQASTLQSDADLNIVSAQDIAVIGSNIKAKDQLSLAAKGNVDISSAANTETSKGTETKLEVKGYAKEQSDKQYRAGVRIEHTETKTDIEKTSNTGSVVSGGSVSVNAGNDVAIKGSTVETTKGNADISGKNVAITASQDTEKSSTSNTVTGGGFYYTGGIDKAGSGYEVGQSSQQTDSNKSTANTSSVKTAGDLNINAGKISNEGTQLAAGGNVALKADSIDNKAASNTSHTDTKSSNWSVDIGANVDYSKITRPVEKAVTGLITGKVSDTLAIASTAGKVGAPNVGIDVQVKAGNSQGSSDSSKAIVSQISGKDISINTKGALNDQATQYKADGSVNIQAGSHDLSAAANTQSSTQNTVQGQADARVYTETGKDVNVNASGKGGNQTTASSQSDAITGSINAKQGININVQDQASYQGSQINAGEGKTVINAGGDVRFDQANNSQSASSNSVDGNAKLNVNVSKSASGGAGVGGQINSSESKASTAVVASLDGKGGVEVKSGKDLTLQGTQIGKQNAAGDVTLQAANKVDFQAGSNSSSKTGSSVGGNISAGGGSSESSEKSSGNVNFAADFNIGKVNESAHSQTAGSINSTGNVVISAGAAAKDAVSLTGTQVKAENVALDAANGGINIQSAQSSKESNNWNVAIGGGAKASQSFNKDSKGKLDEGKDTYGFNAKVAVGVDKQDILQHQNANIEAGKVSINSGKDVSIQGGNIKADAVSGKVGGDLIVSSQQDRDHSTKVDISLGLNAEKHQGKNGLVADKLGGLGDTVKDKATGAVNKAADKVADKYESLAFNKGLKTDTTQAVSFSAKDGGSVTLPEQLTSGPSEGGKVDGLARKAGNGIKDALLGNDKEGSSITPSLDLAVKHSASDFVKTESGISGKQGVTLDVAGKSVLTGAKVESAAGKVDIGQVETHQLSGQEYSVSVGINASTSAGAVISNGIEKISSGTTPVLQVGVTNKAQTIDGGVISAQ